MKKILAMLTAMMTLGLVSCDSDKQENPNDTAISAPVEDISAEPEFMEYNPNDFAQINVAITKQSDEPVIPVNTYDLRKLADIKELSPCRLPENREKLLDERKPAAFNDWTTGNFDEEGFNKFCDTPSEAFFRSFAVCGDKVAVYADYDEVCNYNHCYKIFEYDLKTEEIRELYSYSSVDVGENIWEMNYIDGELYVIKDREDNAVNDKIISEMCHVTDGKLEVLFTMKDIQGRNIAMHFSNPETGRFILGGDSGYTQIEGEELTKFSLVEYDAETGEFSEIFRKEDIVDSNTWENFNVLLNGDEIITTGKGDDRCTFIEGENFRINTGIKGLQVKAVEGNRIIAMTDDTMKTTLYTYDLDKMECYISNANGASKVYLIGGNVLLSYGSSNTLLIPELGASFTVNGRTDGMQFNGYDGGRLWFANAAGSWISGPDGYYIKTSEAVGDLVIIG